MNGIVIYDLRFWVEGYSTREGHILSTQRITDMGNVDYPNGWLVFFKALAGSFFHEVAATLQADCPDYAHSTAIGSQAQ